MSAGVSRFLTRNRQRDIIACSRIVVMVTQGWCSVGTKWKKMLWNRVKRGSLSIYLSNETRFNVATVCPVEHHPCVC